MIEPRQSRREPRPEAKFRVRRGSVYALAFVMVLSVLSLLMRPSRDGKSPEASAYSYSAIGHHGFVRWLTRLGIPNRVAAARPTRNLGPGDTLAVIAPDPCSVDTRCHRFSYNIRRAIDAGANVLVVLPRWTASEDQQRTSVAGRIDTMNQEEVAEVLARTMIAAELRGKPYQVEQLLEEELFFESAFDALGHTAQPGNAVRSASPAEGWLLDIERTQILGAEFREQLEPIVTLGADNELLVGRIRETRVYVMTDPTPFGNASLAEADHADLIAWLLFEELGTRAIVIDETSHIHAQAPRIWDSLFEMPLLPLTLTVMIVFGLLVWMASVRFQLPVDLTANRARGSRALLNSAAAILEEGAAGGEALVAYWEMTIRDVARAFSLPPALSHEERLRSLQSLESGPKIGPILAALDDRVGRLEHLARRHQVQQRIIAVATDIHHFRESYAHGYSAN